MIKKIFRLYDKIIKKNRKENRSDIIMGKNVDIINSFIDYDFGFLVTIGDNVTIINATILAHDASIKKELGYTKVGRVDIGSNVFIGYGAIILPNIKIGNKVIVGAGTVVSKDIPDNVVVCGNPQRILCTYDEYIKKHTDGLAEKPVFKKYCKYKTDKDKLEEFQILSDFKGGYDL